MGKAQKSKSRAKLPQAPWIYVNAPTEDHQYAAALAKLVPKVAYVQFDKSLTIASPVLSTLLTKRDRDQVVIVIGSAFSNDASIKGWGTNHLQLETSSATGTEGVKVTAEKIYKWLFSVFSVAETLHLISEEEMRGVDQIAHFKNYEYCQLADTYKHPCDERIIYVAVILTKPVVAPNKRITFQVADKSGIGNFYFQYRGDTSQYTWNYVLALKQGDRTPLPRTRQVLVKERAYKTVLKAPFRLTGLILRGTGIAVKGIGNGLCKTGNKIKLGKSAEWVSEQDVGIDSKGRKFKKVADDSFALHDTSTVKSEIKVFTDRGNKTWKDDDSIASTTAGSDLDGKKVAV